MDNGQWTIGFAELKVGNVVVVVARRDTTGATAPLVLQFTIDALASLQAIVFSFVGLIPLRLFWRSLHKVINILFIKQQISYLNNKRANIK